MSSVRQQADEIECRALEEADYLDRMSKKPLGKGGLDPTAMRLKETRLEILRDAARTLARDAEIEEKLGQETGE